MKKFYSALSIALVLLTTNLFAENTNLTDLMKKVQDYANQGNYAKALEELEWARKELEKGNANKVKEFFPNEVAGFKGGEIKSENVMGMSSTERTYTKDSATIKVSLTGGSAGGALSGLAGLGKMAAMFGGQAGMNAFRINGRTAQLNEQGNYSDLTVFLDSGSMLKFEGASATDLRAMAEAFNVEKMDNYLRGQG